MNNKEKTEVIIESIALLQEQLRFAETEDERRPIIENMRVLMDWLKDLDNKKRG